MVWFQAAYASKHVPGVDDLSQMIRGTHHTVVSFHDHSGQESSSPDRPWLDHEHPYASLDEQPSRTSCRNPPSRMRMVSPLLRDGFVNANVDV
jgi:hypothetical protein